MNLYTFTNFSQPQPQLQGAPRIIPAGPILGSGSNYLYTDSSGYQLVDVVNGFQWTTTPRTGRQEVPVIFLKEKRLKTNSMIAQAIYYGLALGNVASGAIAGLQNLPPELQRIITGALGALGGARIGQFGGQFIGQLFGEGAAGGTLGTLLGGIFAGTAGANLTPGDLRAALNAFIQNAGRLAQELPSRYNLDSLGSDILGPYEGLYITEDTKFLYNFPYFTNRQNAVNNAFEERDDVFTDPNLNLTGIYQAAQMMREATYRVSTALNFDAPGIYIEKPKFYQFEQAGQVINFSFPLINTGWSDFNDVSMNWQLLYLLTYQNRPNRRSRDLIDPAVIYELTIPGVRFYPFCFIEEMTIDFVGSRRRMNIDVPFGNGITRMNTIIPDAYMVNISLRTLTSETQNFLYSTLYDRQNIVTVTDNYSFLNTAQREFARSFNEVNLLSQLNSTNPADQSGAQTFGRFAAAGLRATGVIQ